MQGGCLTGQILIPEEAIHTLKEALGDFLACGTAQGILHVQVGGAGSVPGLSDLAVPELQVEYIPELGSEQREQLRALGYRECGNSWEHPQNWRLTFAPEGSGWLGRQAALRALPVADAQARASYRAVFERAGREEADRALEDQTTRHYAETVGFGPAQGVARLLTGQSQGWMFAAGMALDLHLGTVTRPHENLDIIWPREEQQNLRPLLHGWRLDAAVDGAYQDWTQPLQAPHFQIHARSTSSPLMLDFMLSDFEDGLWHFRRDPSLTLPLSEARRVTAQGLPYLAPQAALLFKAGREGQTRPKDETDFQRVLPSLTAGEKDWLAAALQKNSPQHHWLRALRG